MDNLPAAANIPPVPRIVEYPEVLAQVQQLGLRSLYPNSGAFGFPASAEVQHVGWIGGEDSSLRPAARALAVLVPQPIESNLGRLAALAWRQHLPGDIWLMPKAHWAYELDFGSAAWMPELLRGNGVEPQSLIHRHDGTALAFGADEASPLAAIVEGLLAHLLGSDFQLMFPARQVVCTVHHHKQLWWSSPDAELIRVLREIPSVAPAGG
jgi:hypothetical protein